jgi:hypothetical protein
MHPPLERPISFRLSAEASRRYEIAAAERGMNLSSYLRDRLEIDDQLAEHIGQLRLTLLDLGIGEQGPAAGLPILIELLLLTRRQTPPGDLRAIHAELERQGISPWTPEAASGSPD